MLAETDLVYYKDEKSARSSMPPQGSIPLDAADVEPYEKEGKEAKPKFKIRACRQLRA